MRRYKKQQHSAWSAPNAAPFNWDVLAAGLTPAAGIALPFVYPPLRRGIRNSPLPKADAGALLERQDS